MALELPSLHRSERQLGSQCNSLSRVLTGAHMMTTYRSACPSALGKSTQLLWRYQYWLEPNSREQICTHATFSSHTSIYDLRRKNSITPVDDMKRVGKHSTHLALLRSLFLEFGASRILCVLVTSCTVVIHPCLIFKFSCITLTTGAKQLVVQDAAVTI